MFDAFFAQPLAEANPSTERAMTRPAWPSTIVDHPLVSFGCGVCGNLAAGLRREWLVARRNSLRQL